MTREHCDLCDTVLKASEDASLNAIEGYSEKFGTFRVRVFAYKNGAQAKLCDSCWHEVRQHRGTP